MRRQFHSDNARPCPRCDCTIATYTVDTELALIEVFCHGCHMTDEFVPNDHAARPMTAADVSASHRRTR